MAIVKILKITSKSKQGIEAATKYIDNDDKTTTSATTTTAGVEHGDENRAIEQVISYAANGEKTEEVKLVTGINCRPETADIEMRATAEYWKSRKGSKTAVTRDAFHIIQSFDPKDNDKLTPEEVHQIGVDFAESLQHMDDHESDPNRTYRMLVCTHVDKEHLHNHIVLCSYDLLNGHMFHECKDVYQMMRDKSDELCRAHDLSVVENPDNDRRRSRAEWENAKNGTSWKDNVRKDIVAFAEISSSWGEFKQNMKDAGYELREGKYITYTTPDGKKVRDKTLGVEYTQNSLLEFWYKEAAPAKDGARPVAGTSLEDAITTIEVERYFDDDLKDTAKDVLESGGVFYDENGHRRSNVEVVLVVLLKMITGLDIEDDGRDMSSGAVKAKEGRVLFQNRIRNSISVAKKYNLNTTSAFEQTKKAVGSELGSCKKEINKLTRTLDKSGALINAVETYKEHLPLIDKINALPEGEAKEQIKHDNADVLYAFKNAKAVMYKSGCVTDKQIDEFTGRVVGWQNRLSELEDNLKDLNIQYKDLLQISSGLELAKEKGFKNTVLYHPDNSDKEKIKSDEKEKIEEPVQQKNNIKEKQK